MKARWNVSTTDNAAPRPNLSSGGRTLATTTSRSLGRRMWIVLAIAGLAACSEAGPDVDAKTSGAATTTTSVPTLAVAYAPCGEVVVPGGVDDFPEGRRLAVACPAPCGEAVVPGGVDDFPEGRRLAVACPASRGEAVVPGGVDDFPEGRRLAVAREAGDR